MQLVLKPHQVKIVEWILSHERCAIWASMGSGKTISVLFALSYIQLTDPSPALVVAPLRVAQSVWKQEVERWSAFSSMTVSLILGSSSQRFEALKAPASLYVINYENLQWLRKTCGENWKFKTVIIDESTKLKSFRLSQGNKSAKALARYAWRGISHLIELTGTPSPNGLIDLWGQIWFLDKGRRLGLSFTEFVNRWFTTRSVGAHANAIKHLPKESAEAEITECLKDLCLSIDICDIYDIKQPFEFPLRLPLPSCVVKEYKKLARKYYCDIAGEVCEASSAVAKSCKLLQMANGAVYLDDEEKKKKGKKNWVKVHDEKIKALKVLQAKANDQPILVAYHFNCDLERLFKSFPQGRKLDKNPSTIKEWNEGKIPLLFAHPASCGHGLNLQYGGNILVFFSLWWDLETHQQMVERIGNVRQRQAGLNRGVYVYYLIAENTIDELVLQRLQTKESVQECLLKALKTESNNVRLF